MKDLWPDNNVMIRLDLETAVILAISHGWQHISVRSVPLVSQYHVKIFVILLLVSWYYLLAKERGSAVRC